MKKEQWAGRKVSNPIPNAGGFYCGSIPRHTRRRITLDDLRSAYGIDAKKSAPSATNTKDGKESNSNESTPIVQAEKGGCQG